MLVGCGGPEDEGEQGGTEPAQKPAKETASEDYPVMRVSGTSGITYSNPKGPPKISGVR